MRKLRALIRWWSVRWWLVGMVAIVVAVYFNVLTLAEGLQILIMYTLVLVTAQYAKSAAEQAGASRKMAEEMREQRLTTSRPIIIQKAIHEKEVWEGSTSDYFSHFEVYNAGNGPAIELEISLLNKERDLLEARRETFLRAGEPPIKFHPFNLAGLEESTYYLACEYQPVFSCATEQTLLPFKLVKSSAKSKVYVAPGKIEFKSGVSEKNRINAFSNRSKPK